MIFLCVLSQNIVLTIFGSPQDKHGFLLCFGALFWRNFSNFVLILHKYFSTAVRGSSQSEFRWLFYQVYNFFWRQKHFGGIWGNYRENRGCSRKSDPQRLYFSSILTIFAAKSAVNVELCDHMDRYDSSNWCYEVLICFKVYFYCFLLYISLFLPKIEEFSLLQPPKTWFCVGVNSGFCPNFREGHRS